MSQTIETDARRNSKLRADLDNFRSKYIEVDFEVGLSVKFPSGEIWAYEQNFFSAIANAKVVPFKPRWSMRPDYVSFDVYGTEIYWSLILFVNGIMSIEDFHDLETIIIPDASSLLSVIRHKLPSDSVVQVISNPPPIVDQSLSLLTRSPMDDLELQQIAAESNLQDAVATPTTTIELINLEETFELEPIDITNAYVDLQYVPINATSISMYVDNFNIPQRYGYDYILKADSFGSNKRISWKLDDVIGTGLQDVFETGTTVKITYIYEQITEG